MQGSLSAGLEESTITAMGGGSANPNLEGPLKFIDETAYNVVISPHEDLANMTWIDLFLEARWRPENPIDGHAFIASDQSSVFLKQTATAQIANRSLC